ncbi:sigma-70 family RNA polymerase sigma factor [Amycolatopsis cihanbeyliensis]|uniref:RNA polymerase sigma-70 factor (ECF subfamily) n=1 Tax=Amycolatopsis cihanbeyliensis TaxID=1128664 RepID=A0A542DHQ6_AMYCI|nr:sigma-70 family RNA polymerase sigma factor [Amycolatopsis cihanbeyliensis]TQJ02613.1 RNA polymerase sigma-70 factor (ECF subfamily) [Amycolatopsis cihanbeyliensis]
MEDDELTDLALRAAAGNRTAAEGFVSATQHQLHRMLGYLVEPRLAEDLVQETYLRAFTALPRYAARCPARMWLLAIAKRVAADHLRTRKRRPQHARTPDWTGVAERAGAAEPDHGRLVDLRRLVAELSPERRESFVLTQVLGLSYAEAALVCECAIGTIRSRVARARQDLLTWLGPAGAGKPAAGESRM